MDVLAVSYTNLGVLLGLLSVGIGIMVTLARQVPWGLETVNTLKDLLDARERKIAELQAKVVDHVETIHQREREIAEMVGEIKQLNERPTLETLYAQNEVVYAQNDRRERMHEENTRMLTEILERIGVLVDRQRQHRRDDAT